MRPEPDSRRASANQRRMIELTRKLSTMAGLSHEELDRAILAFDGIHRGVILRVLSHARMSTGGRVA